MAEMEGGGQALGPTATAGPALGLFHLGCWMSFPGFVLVLFFLVWLVLLLDIQSFAHLSALSSSRSVD